MRAAERKLITGAQAAHVAVARAVRHGLIKPARQCVCVDCGAAAEHLDHRDYNRPLEVEPVCRKCNYKRGPALPVFQPVDGRKRVAPGVGL